jgi:hypothetical protein
MALKNHRILYTAKNFTTGLSDVTAIIRRDGVQVASGVSLADIGNGEYELLLTPALITTYGGAGYYDFWINSAFKNAPAPAGRWITVNDNDDLEIHLVTIETKIDTIDSNVDQVLLDTTSIKTTVEDSNTKINDPAIGLSNLKTLIDNATQIVSNISNVTRFNAPLPKPLIRKESGTKTYKIPVYLYDNNGDMEDPNANEIQVAIEDESGNSRDSLITGFSAQPHYINRDAQGQYNFELTIPDNAALEQLNFKFEYTEGIAPNDKTLIQGATTEIIQEAAASGLALETTSQEILTDTADMQPRVLDIQTKINDATYGLSAIKALIDIVNTNTDGVEGELTNATYGLAAIRTQLDLKASQSSINVMQSDVTDIKTSIDTLLYTGGRAI